MSGNVVRTFDDVQERFDEANARTLTATAAGAQIDADASFVTVTSDTATKIVFLPAAVDGKRLDLFVVATGAELRSIVAADKLNNVVVGATNEGALVAATLYSLTYNATTGNWTMNGVLAAGTVAPLVVPDAV